MQRTRKVLQHVIAGYVIEESSEPFSPPPRSSSSGDDGGDDDEWRPPRARPTAVSPDSPGEPRACKEAQVQAGWEHCRKITLRAKSKKTSCANRSKRTKSKMAAAESRPKQAKGKATAVGSGDPGRWIVTRARARQRNATGAGEQTISLPSSSSWASTAPLGAESAADETEDLGSEIVDTDSDVHANLGNAEQSQDSSNNTGSPAVADDNNNYNDAADQQPEVDPFKWSVTDVYEFVQQVPGCADYAEDFAIQQIDGRALMLLKVDHLTATMKMKLGPALKICAEIDAMRIKKEK